MLHPRGATSLPVVISAALRRGAQSRLVYSLCRGFAAISFGPGEAFMPDVLELDSGAPCLCETAAVPPISAKRNSIGLHATSFFLAELTGVVAPFLSEYLRMQGWGYDAIGALLALTAFGALLMQTPAGVLVDRTRRPRALLAGSSVLLGLCYGLVPAVPTQWRWMAPLLLAAGLAKTLFNPALGALTLGLAGHQALNKTWGMNQCCNHLGNIAAALSAMAIVSWLTVSWVFFAVTAVSLLAAVSVSLIRPEDLTRQAAVEVLGEEVGCRGRTPLRQLFCDRRIAVLCLSTAMFHLANAPIMPLVGLYVKRLDGSDRQLAAVVLVAQSVMIPVALMSGWLCDRWGRKWTLAIGFGVLPLRIWLYLLATSPGQLVALQALDGVGAGVLGVAVVAVCADLMRGTGRFNSLAGFVATGSALGGVLGAFISGMLVEHCGFAATFEVFAAIAVLAAVVFVCWMPETGPQFIVTSRPRA